MTRAARGAFGAAFLAAAWLLAGCASAPRAEPSLYERLGGRAGIAAVVDDGIANIAADSRINRRFANAGPDLARHLVDLLCLRTGGPCTYTGRNMADAHDGMQIDDAEFDALLDDIARALDRHKVPARERVEVMAALAQMRNAIVGH